MLKRKVGNCCIQRTEPIKQKKRNGIKMSTPVEVRPSQIRQKGLRWRNVNTNHYIVIFPLAFVNIVSVAE